MGGRGDGGICCTEVDVLVVVENCEKWLAVIVGWWRVMGYEYF